MRVKYTTEMREKIQIGICISTFTLFLYFILTHFEIVASIWNRIIGVCTPFILGFAFAFLLNPIMMIIENKVFKNWNCVGKKKRVVSLLITFVIAIAFIAFLLYLIVPSIIDSISDLVKNNEVYIKQYSKLVSDFVSSNNLDKHLTDSIVGTGDQLLSSISKLFPSIISTSYGVVSGLMKTLIGLAAGLYLLLDKEKFLKHVKKVNFALFPSDVAIYLKRLTNDAKDIFNNFIVGKAIDSLIIGIICYIGLSLLNIKFAGLLSVIVGITNMIPVFGPFIGAIPGILLLLITSPHQCIIFALFILILQQFDGNILGPLILGDKLGLPSFWILFSVTVGGAFFGVIGMFIGVPMFAVIYFAFKEYINFRLEKKEINIQDSQDE